LLNQFNDLFPRKIVEILQEHFILVKKKLILVLLQKNNYIKIELHGFNPTRFRQNHILQHQCSFYIPDHSPCKHHS